MRSERIAVQKIRKREGRRFVPSLMNPCLKRFRFFIFWGTSLFSTQFLEVLVVVLWSPLDALMGLVMDEEMLQHLLVTCVHREGPSALRADELLGQRKGLPFSSWHGDDCHAYCGSSPSGIANSRNERDYISIIV